MPQHKPARGRGNQGAAVTTLERLRFYLEVQPTLAGVNAESAARWLEMGRHDMWMRLRNCGSGWTQELLAERKRRLVPGAPVDKMAKELGFTGRHGLYQWCQRNYPEGWSGLAGALDFPGQDDGRPTGPRPPPT